MSSLAAFLSKFKSIEADEMIDLKVRAASNTTKQRITEKSLFTQSTDQLRYRRYKSKRIESQIPSSQSETAVADIPVARRNWDERPLAAASQRSADSETDVYKAMQVYAPTCENRDNALVRGSPVSPASSSMPKNALPTTPPVSLSMPELYRKTVLENNLPKDSLQMSVTSNTTYSNPGVLRPSSSIYSPFSFKSSISDFSAGSLPVNQVQAEKFDESPAQSTQKLSFRGNTKKISGATENTKKFLKINTKQQKPGKAKQELKNKPLPAVPVSVPAAKLSREPHLHASNHVASLMSKYEASAPVWADSDESPIDKYFHPHRVVNEKQAAFDLEFELHKIFDQTQKEEHVMAPLNSMREIPAQVLHARGPSGRSGNLLGPKTLKAVPSTMDWSAGLPPNWQPPTPKFDDEEAKPIDGGSLVNLEDLISNSYAQPPLGETCRLSTMPSNTFVRAGIIPQLRPTVVSKYADSLDDVGLYTRSFILDSPSTPSPIEGKNKVVGDGNDTMSQGDKIFIKLNRVENVTLNFHFLRPGS